MIPGTPTDEPTAFGRECLHSADGKDYGLRAPWRVYCKFEKGHDGDHSYQVSREEETDG